MTVATGNFAELLWPGIHETFGTEYEDYPPVYRDVFTVERSTLGFEKEQGVTGLPLAGVKEQGGAVTYADPIQAFQKEFVHVVYGLGSSVTREMWEDDQYRYIMRLPRFLARSMRQTEETVHSNIFNNGFSTELTADGVAIFASTHPNAATSTTQSNIPNTASDLTQTSLEQAYIDIAGWQDDQDLRIQVTPRRLVVPRQLMWTAEKILRTQYEVGSADNTINPMNGKIPHSVWNYLTDADAWFVMTSVTDCGFMSFTRRETQAERENEFDTQNLKFMVSRRWSAGVTDWHAAYASAGA